MMSDHDTNYMSGLAAISAPLSCHILRFVTLSFLPKTTKLKIGVPGAVALLSDRKRFSQIVAVI